MDIMAAKKIGKTKFKKLEKPKFIPKKVREARAKNTETVKRKEARIKEKEIEKSRKNFLSKVRQAKRLSTYGERENQRQSRLGEEKEKPLNREDRLRTAKERRRSENKEKLKKDIKLSYLGLKKREKRKIPVDHRQRFCFDWEPEDDTSNDFNELYARKADITLAFGRGFRAGEDRAAQRERNTVYAEMLRKHKDRDVKALERIIERKEERVKRLEKKRRERKSQHQVWRKKSIREMTARDWRICKEDFNITTRGAGLYNPIRNWKESGLNKEILETLKKVGYKEPTPIQRIAIPVGIANRDIVGIAETGSGKTCAFVLPMLTYILKLPPMTPQTAANGPYAIILAPSRELAQQIEGEMRRFADPLGINTVSIIGGSDLETQAMDLRTGAEVIIATPGRLSDVIERKFLVLNQCNYIVLDEADRMIDMGFEPQVVDIFEKMSKAKEQPENPDEIDKKKVYRQTIMFSATMPPPIEKLSKKYLRNPMFLAIGDRFGKTADMVRQNVEFVTENEKRKAMQDLLERIEPPIMIFSNHKRQCDILVKYLNSQGYNCASLHGGKSQESREAALEEFRSHDVDILICTDVAGRGIDVKGVTHVINYDMPKNMEYYTHRIGRTGRAGSKGEATSFLTNGDEEMFFELKKLLIKTNNIVPPELASHPASMHAPGSVELPPKIQYAV